LSPKNRERLKSKDRQFVRLRLLIKVHGTKEVTQTMGWKVLLPQGLRQEGRDLLEKHGHKLIDGRGFTTEEVIEDMKKYQPDAIVVVTTKMTRAVFEAASPNLKVLARYGAGYDAVDLEAAADYGAKCLYAPVANSTTVAEVALLLMLYMSRNVTHLRNMLTVDYYAAKMKTPMVTLKWQTVGIVGCGNVGTRTATRCVALGMRVLCYDPHKRADEFPEGVEVVRYLDKIFKESDFVSLHVPSTPVTRGMVDKTKLDMMKPTAFLINTARGAIVNENDLYEACKNHTIAGAGLDVVAHEPMDPDLPLAKLENVLILPHTGGYTNEASRRASYFTAQGIEEVYEGKTPTWPIPSMTYDDLPVYTDTREAPRKQSNVFDPEVNYSSLRQK
jgi:D-3-phosphoglycerate dehydrogenase